MESRGFSNNFLLEMISNNLNATFRMGLYPDKIDIFR